MSPSAFFLNPPGLPGTTANREGSAGMGALVEQEGAFTYPPHLLATTAAVLRDAGWQVAGLDAAAAGLKADQTLARLPATDVLILPVSHATLAADRAFLNRLRELKPLQQVLAIGPALSYPQVAHAFDDLADLLLAGEPELALPAACRYLATGNPPPGLPQDAARPLRPGQVVNPYVLAPSAYEPDGRVADLDALPVPAWELFQQNGIAYPFLTVLSSRGCPAGCAFCPYVASQGAEHRCQSPGRTLMELTILARRFQAGHVMFRDPVFAHERSRVLALCSELRHANLPLTWECESRPEHFDGRLLRAMQAAGCTTIKLGLESADPELLVAIGRVPDEVAGRAYVRHVAGLVAECRQLGLTCRVFVMAGLPGQTAQSIQQTADFLRELRPARLHVKPYHWYPGIVLPQVEAEHIAGQIALLEAAGRWRLPRWRRLLQRVISKH